MMSTPVPPSVKERESKGVLLALKLVFELGYIIALPIVLFGFGGAYADKAWGTSPWMLLLGIVFAASISILGVTRKIRLIQKTEFGSESRS